MGSLISVFILILIAIGLVLVAGVYAEPIVSMVRRRLPRFTYEGDSVLLWGLFSLTVLVCGTIFVYLLTRP